MPSFVVVKGSFDRNGEADAVMSDPGLAGADLRSHLPVRIKHLSDSVLSIDGEAHTIVSATGGNGAVEYVIEGSTYQLRNRERRIMVARALARAKLLGNSLVALKDGSEEPEEIVGVLGELFNLLRREKERLAAPPRAVEDQGERDDDTE